MIERCCAFTGHRPKKFPWGYNEADARCLALKKAIAEEIAKLVEMGYTDFLSGMAISSVIAFFRITHLVSASL